MLDTEIQDEFLCDLANVITTNSSSAILYIARDSNSKLGLREQDETFMGRHSKRHRNMCDSVEPIRMIERNPFRQMGVSTVIRTPCASIT